MALETGKQRSSRIQMDYYRRPDRWKFILSISAFFIAALYALFVIFAGPGSHVSTGPLAEVHASFENECQKCHQNSASVAGSGSAFNLGAFNKHEVIHRTAAACRTCHQVGGHYPHVLTDEGTQLEQNCAACHSDHNGLDHDLLKVENHKCLKCHANLNSFCSIKISERRAIVSSFTDAHPGFSSLAKDNGTVLFDHHQHLHPGQVNPGDKGAFTRKMLPESASARYNANANGSIQLTCSDCHHPGHPGDRVGLGDPIESITMAADQEIGRYMAPVNFEKHCSACHSLNFGIQSPNRPPIPHAVPWNELEFLLAAAINGARATEATRLPRDDTRNSPRPGEGHGGPAPDSFLVSKDEVSKLRERVHKQCLKCHSAESIDGIGGAPKPMVPPRWLQYGLFDHAAHREFNCKHCHADAYPPPVGETRAPPMDHTKVMIRDRASCVGCHRDAQTPTPAQVLDLTDALPMWASDRCTLCHRYHGHPQKSSTASAEVQR